MPVIHPIQTAFIGGRVSAKMRGRVDLPIHRYGLEECDNFEPTAQGTLLMRGGTEKIATAASENVRLVEAKTRSGSFILELTPLEMRIRNAVSAALQQNSPNLITDGAFDSLCSGWQFNPPSPYLKSSGSPYNRGFGDYGAALEWMHYASGTPYQGEWRFPDSKVQQHLSIAVDAALVYTIEFDAYWMSTVAGTLTVKVGTTAGAQDITHHHFTHADEGLCSFTFNSGANLVVFITFEMDNVPMGYGKYVRVRDPVLKVAGSDDRSLAAGRIQRTTAATVVAATDYHLTVEFVDRIGDVTKAGDVRVEVGSVRGAHDVLDTTISALGATVLDVNSGGFTSLWVSISRVSLDSSDDVGVIVDNIELRLASGATVVTTLWDAAHLAGVQCAHESAVDKVYLAQRSIDLHYLLRNADATWTLAKLSSVGGAALPGEWTGSNHPGVVEVVQSRLLAASTPAELHRVWASKVGLPHDFGLGSGLDSDGLDLKIATQGGIQWARDGRDLLISTDLGEHALLASGGVLTPSDRHVRGQNACGSAAIQAVRAGPRTVFVGHDGKTLQSALYEQQSDGVELDDLTFHSSDILDGIAKELQYARRPGSVVVLMSNGSLALCTYNPRKEVVAWWTMDVGGEVKSMAVADTSAGTYLWLAVKRANGTYIERMAWSNVSVYLDAHTVTTLTAGQTVVTGLDHLEGETVNILLDGAMQPSQVVTGGQITLEETGAVVVVGLPYEARAKTLPLEGGNPGGTSQGFLVHYSDITVRVNNSARPLVNGERVGKGRPFSTPADTAEALASGDYTVSSLKVEVGGQIEITQDLPFRTEVCAVFGQAHLSRV